MLKNLKFFFFSYPQTTILKSSRLFGGSKKQALKEVKRYNQVSCTLYNQRAKKLVSDSLGLVDFAIGQVNSFLNLPDEKVKVFEEFKLQKNCEINSARQKAFGAS